jgi:predicted transcriptional regulator
MRYCVRSWGKKYKIKSRQWPGERAFMKNLILVLLSASFVFGQDSTITSADSSKTDSLKLALIDSTLFLQKDTLALQLTFPIKKTIPKNVISIPKPSSNRFEVDTRSGSYYTPRNVQDKIDRGMGRPRSDSFAPVMAMAFFAASIAAKQLEIDKLFELKAADYLIPDGQFSILEKLWVKAPQRIDGLYLSAGLKDETSAKELQTRLASLADKGLVKTRDAGKDNIFFYPAQRRERVIKLFKKALNDTTNSKETQYKLAVLLKRLENLSSQNNKQNDP